MSCTITVHPQQTDNLARTPPMSPDHGTKVARSPHSRSPHNCRNSKVAFQQAGALFPPPPLPLPLPLPQSPISPTSQAYQDVGEAVLQFDASRSMSPRRGDLSESQSSFYDSDDIFSDFETPVNLEKTFDSAGYRNYGQSVLDDAVEKSAELNSSSGSSAATVRLQLEYASRKVDYVINVEEFSFRPSHLVVRCGDFVRFRRPSSQAVASLICEGQFFGTDVNIPVQGDYLCIDHCFNSPGSFDVQNVIFTFCKCNVIVIPQSAPPLLSSVRKGATPKLLGSFNGAAAPIAAPVQPVFHLPISEEEKKALKVPSHKMTTVTTTVNATTTSVVSTTQSPFMASVSSVTTSATMSRAQVELSNHEDDDQSNGKKGEKKGPSETTPLSKPVPLYGSFMNLSGGVGSHGHGTGKSSVPLVPADSTIEAYINRFVSTLHTHEEGSEDSEAVGNEEESAAAIRKKKKNQRKKERLKMKKKLKKEEEATLETAEEIIKLNLQVDTNLYPDSRALDPLDPERSPEVVIGRYLSDATISRSRIQAQVDWGEEMESEDDEEEAVLQAAAVPREVVDESSREPHPAEEAASTPINSYLCEPASSAQVVPPEQTTPTENSLLVAAEEEANVVAPPVSSEKKKRRRSKSKKNRSPDVGVETLQTEEAAADVSIAAADGTARLEELIFSPIVTQLSSLPSTPPRCIVPEPAVVRTPVAVASIPTLAASTAQNGQQVPASDPDHSSAKLAHSVENVMLSPESFVTPTKARKPRREKEASKVEEKDKEIEHTSDKRADAVSTVSTPLTAETPVEGDTLSRRNSQLLRSVLRISSQPKGAYLPSTILFPPTAAPGPLVESSVDENVSRLTPASVEESAYADSAKSISASAGVASDSQLSVIYAFEAQMEEFFLSRYESVMDRFRSGEKDRTASGKEVDIFNVEDLHEVTVKRSKNNNPSLLKQEPPAVPKKSGRKRK